MMSHPLHPSRAARARALWGLFLLLLAFAAPAFCDAQPDLHIRAITETVYAGDDIYNSDGAGQTKQRTVDAGLPGIYQITIQNDGPDAGTFQIAGPEGNADWTVAYYDALIDGNPITLDVTGDGWIIGPLASGAALEFRVEVTPAPSLSKDSSLEILITATAVDDPALLDTVECATTVSGSYTINAFVSYDGTRVETHAGAGNSLSTDGRYVVFDSRAHNFVPNDTNDHTDTFVRDLLTNQNIRINLSPTGAQADGSSSYPSISPNGRYVLFMSYAKNLVANDEPLTNLWSHLFRCDRVTGEIIRVNIAHDGTQADSHTERGVVSADGRYVAFWSYAANLVTGHGTPLPYANVFLRDCVTGEMRLVNANRAGQYPVGSSDNPVITPDGRYVVFPSGASDLVAEEDRTYSGLYIYDVQNRTLEEISVTNDGSPAPYRCDIPSITPDGRFIVFISESLLLPDGIAGKDDVFVRDRVLGFTERVSVSSSGEQSHRHSFVNICDNIISADGRYVVFSTIGDDLTPEKNPDIDYSTVSNNRNVYLRDRLLQKTELISKLPNGRPLHGHARSIDATGRRILFYSGPEILPDGETFFGRLYVRIRSEAPAPELQPDLHISAGVDTEVLGDNLYNADGMDQTATQITLLNTPVIYPITLQNDGETPYSFQMVGTEGGDGWSVTYFDALEGGMNITDQIAGDGWITPVLGVGQSLVIRVEVSPDGELLSGATKEVLLTVISLLDQTKSDTVKAVTTAIAPYRPDLQIRNAGDAEYLGDDLYNADGADQTAQRVEAPGTELAFPLKVENDGGMADSFRITGTAGDAQWTVAYYDALDGGDPQTEAVTGDGWTVGPLEPGASLEFRVVLTSTTGQGTRLAKNVLITATSETDPTLADTVKAAAAANSAPEGVADAYATDEDTLLTVAAPGVLANDTDVEEDGLTVILVADAQHGTLVLNDDGSFTYQPDDDWHGEDSFTYRAFDGLAYSAPATVTLTVNPINDAPEAVADAYATDEDTLLTVAAPGVLANDTDAEEDGLTVILVADAQHGTLILNDDGSFTYLPDDDWHGEDSFTYRVSDGWTTSATTTVTLTVNPINDAPVAADDEYAVDEDTPLTVDAPGVLANDTDAEEDGLTAVLETDAQHGTLTLNADGSFLYQPDDDWHGEDSFTYRAFDGEAYSAPATVTLTVSPINDAPTAADDLYYARENTLLTVEAPGVLENDGDVDEDALTAVLVTDVQHGTLTLNEDGSFTYLPDEDWHGEDSFTYRAFDGEETSGIATVTLMVLAYQPDLWLDGEGNGLYTVAAQVTTATRAVGEAAVYVLEVENDGNADDYFTITGDADDGDWTVAYYDAELGGEPITEEVTGDGWVVGPLEPGARVTFRLEVTPGPAAAGGAEFPVEVRAVSWGHEVKEDTVRAVTTKAPLSAVTLTADPFAVQYVYDAVTLTATPTDGGQVEYCFFVKRGGGEYELLGVGYDAAPQYTYTGLAPGAYTFLVWAREGDIYVSNTLDYTFLPPPITGVTLEAAPASPQFTDTPITLTAEVTGGFAVEYRFFAGRDGGAYETLQGYGPSATCAWQPALPGRYHLIVWAREVGNSASRVHATCYFTVMAPLAGVALASVPEAATAVGTPITLTATPDGGMAVEYRFSVSINDAPFDEVRPYAAGRTLVYTPAAPGSYRFLVEARETGGGDPLDCSAERTVTAGAPMSGLSLLVDPAAPRPAGYPVTLTAAPLGGHTLEYRFFVSLNGGAWTTLRAYAASPSLTWTPAAAGNYILLVWAREVGSTRNWEAYATATYRVVPALSAVGLAVTPASPRLINTPLTLTATPTGGQNVEYRFSVHDGTGWVTLQPYSGSRTCAFTPTTPGAYQFLVWAREVGSPHNYDVYASTNFQVQPYLSGVSLAADPASPVAVNRRVRFTATPAGGARVEYRYYLSSDGITWTRVREYATQTSFDWTPTAVGAYRMMVWAREVGSPASWDAYAIVHLDVQPGVSAVTLSTNPSTRVAVNRPVTLTASAVNGLDVEYRFLAHNGTAWTTLRAYHRTPTVEWTPTSAGNYTLLVYAREVGTPAAWQAYATRPFTVVSAISGVALTASPDSPQPAGTAVTFTATPAGGDRVEYEFRVFNGTAWTLARPYEETPNFTWTPNMAGTYAIQVRAREVGLPATEVWALLSYTVLLP